MLVHFVKQFTGVMNERPPVRQLWCILCLGFVQNDRADYADYDVIGNLHTKCDFLLLSYKSK